MKSLEQIRVDNWYAQLQAELNVELSAAQDYYERAGKDYDKQTPTEQRKILENWKEDHE